MNKIFLKFFFFILILILYNNLSIIHCLDYESLDGLNINNNLDETNQNKGENEENNYDKNFENLQLRLSKNNLIKPTLPNLNQITKNENKKNINNGNDADMLIYKKSQEKKTNEGKINQIEARENDQAMEMAIRLLNSALSEKEKLVVAINQIGQIVNDMKTNDNININNNNNNNNNNQNNEIELKLDDLNNGLKSLNGFINMALNVLSGLEMEMDLKDEKFKSLLMKQEKDKTLEEIKKGRLKMNYETGHFKVGGNMNSSTINKNYGLLKLEGKSDPAVLHLDIKFLRDIVALSAAAAFFGILCAYVNIPANVGYIIGGMIIGPSGLNLISELIQVETLAQFGCTFFLFRHGMMYSTHFSEKKSPPLLVILKGILGFSSILFVVTILVFQWPNLVSSAQQAIFLSIAITLSSTSIVTLILERLHLTDTRYGNHVVDIQSIQDLLIAPLLALPAIMHNLAVDFTFLRLISILAYYTIGITVMLVIARWIFFNIIGNFFNNKKNWFFSDLQTLGIVSYCWSFAMIVEWLGLSHEAGAVFAGLAIAGSPYAKQTEAIIEPLTNLFSGLYMAALGLILSPYFIIEHFPDVMHYILSILVIKIIVFSIVVFSFGFSIPCSVASGIHHAHVSDVSLLFLAKTRHLNLLPRPIYLLMVSTIAIVFGMAPLALNVLKHIDRKQFEHRSHASFWEYLGVVLPLEEQEKRELERKNKNRLKISRMEKSPKKKNRNFNQRNIVRKNSETKRYDKDLV